MSTNQFTTCCELLVFFGLLSTKHRNSSRLVTAAGAHLPVAVRSIETIWLRSSMNCDCPTAVASWLARRVKMRSVSPMTACVRGWHGFSQTHHRHYDLMVRRARHNHFS